MRILAEGSVCGCMWRIAEEDTRMALTLNPDGGDTVIDVPKSEDYFEMWPWLSFRHIHEIKTVTARGTVHVLGCAACMFFDMSGCRSFGLENLDTSGVKTMEQMFGSCRSVEKLSGLAGWDVSSVEDMGCMFSDCPSLSDISALAGWDVSSTADMSFMFNHCRSLTDISPLAGWDTGRVRNMAGMFADSGISDLSPLSAWNTSSAENMNFMFFLCPGLTDASPVRNWNVRNVKYMDLIFNSFWFNDPFTHK